MSIKMDLVVLILTLLVNSGQSDLYPEEKPKCEEISIPMCRGIGYNMTSMPNQFHHEKQDEAGLEVHQFWPLVQIGCSDDLRFFLCSMYTPICMEDYHDRLPACRSVCERARVGCAPIMKQYGFDWPETMDCNNFPPYGSTDRLCMDQKEGAKPNYDRPEENSVLLLSSTQASLPLAPTSISSKLPSDPLSSPIIPQPPIQSSSTPTNVIKGKEKERTKGGKTRLSSKDRSNVHVTMRYPDTPYNTHGTPRQCHCFCRPPMIQLHEIIDHRYYNRVETGGILNCAQPCHSAFFSKQEQSTAFLIITVTSFACLLCSLLVVFTYLVDRDRFRYPERAIIFLSGCYIIISLGFLLRYHLGHEAVSCDGPKLRYSGLGNHSGACIIVFLFIYFFGMAASLWWVILTLAWFLSASLKWGAEAIEGYSLGFHILAWFVPAIKSFAILAMDAIDGEPLAGICLVGNLNVNNLMTFVIGPLCTYLTIGIILLLAGFVSLVRIRRVIRQQARVSADKVGLEKLMARIIIFSVLYIVPTIVVIICNLYQYYYGPIWEKNFNCPCLTPRPETPYVRIHLLKYIMFLVVGIATCFWILSGKTLESWWRCLAKICCCRWDNSKSSNNREQLIGSTNVGGGSSQYIVNSQRSYKQINHIAQLSSSGQPHRKISLSHV